MAHQSRIAQAEDMYLAISHVNRNMATRKGQPWTYEQDVALAQHCADYHHIKLESLKKALWHTFGERDD